MENRYVPRIWKLEINKPHEMKTTKTITCIVSNGARAHTRTHTYIQTYMRCYTIHNAFYCAQDSPSNAHCIAQPAYFMTKAILYRKMAYKSRESNQTKTKQKQHYQRQCVCVRKPKQNFNWKTGFGLRSSLLIPFYKRMKIKTRTIRVYGFQLKTLTSSI